MKEAIAVPFWRKTSGVGRLNKTRMPFNYKMKILASGSCPAAAMGPLDETGKRHLREAITSSGRFGRKVNPAPAGFFLLRKSASKTETEDANENTEFHLPATVRPRTPCHPDGLGGHGTGRMHKERGAAAGGAPGSLGRC